MSLSLYIARSVSDIAAEQAWAAVLAVAPTAGTVNIEAETVRSIARLLDGQMLTNGERISAYAYDDEDETSPFIDNFGPSLLPVSMQDYVRDRLACATNGAAAARLFDTIIRLGLQVTFTGSDLSSARMTAVNTPADEVKITWGATKMYAMLGDLGVDLEAANDPDMGFGSTSFGSFASLVEANGHKTSIFSRLQALVACGHRNNAERVYWA